MTTVDVVWQSMDQELDSASSPKNHCQKCRDTTWLLRSPCHVDLDRNFVLHWHRQQRGRIDFEIRQLGGNGSRQVNVGPLFCELKLDLFILRGLAGELNL